MKEAWTKSGVAALEIRVVALVAFGSLAWLTLNGVVTFSEVAALGTVAVVIGAVVGQLARWYLRSVGRFEDHVVLNAREFSEENRRVIMMTGVAIALVIVVLRNVTQNAADLSGTLWAQGLLSVGVAGRMALLVRTVRSATRRVQSSPEEF